MKIIIIVGYNIGDCVCLSAAIRALKRCKPEITIDLLSNTALSAETFQYNPDINQIFIDLSKEQIAKIKAQYDFAISFPIVKENCSILKRLGLKTFFPSQGDMPLSESALDLMRFLFPECKAEKVSKYYLHPQPHHFEKATQLLKNAGAKLSKDEILIGCHIGCLSMAHKKKNWLQRRRGKFGSKAWPLKNYVALLEKLITNNPHIRFVLTGTLAETPIINSLFKKHKNYVYNVAGKTDVLTLAAMMQLFKCFLSGDTGPMHVAVAMDIPLIALFSTKTQLIGQPYPTTDYRKIIVKPKTADITVNEVEDALKILLDISLNYAKL